MGPIDLEAPETAATRQFQERIYGLYVVGAFRDLCNVQADNKRRRIMFTEARFPDDLVRIHERFKSGRWWIIGITKQMGVYVWDTSAPHLALKTVSQPSEISSLDICHDGTILATAAHDHKIRVYECRDAPASWEFDCQAQEINAVAFHPSKPVLACVGINPVLSIWNMDLKSPQFGTKLSEKTGRADCLGAKVGGARVMNASILRFFHERGAELDASS